MELNAPVVLLIFNRPELTERVFTEIARSKPKKLFVVADGPRSPDEADLCAQTRAVTERIDWECEVLRDYSEVNLGCRQRSASGFDWVFSQVEEAIFFDDDCLPDPTFFRFCEEALERFRDDTRVMMITGSNYLESWKADKQSYHFSYFGSPWGWASWRRAWQYYDVTMSGWGDEELKARVRDVLGDGEWFAVQGGRFDRLHANTADRHSWDVPWTFARLVQSGLTVVPAVNLISNIGCLGESTIAADWPTANLPTQPMSFPMRPPTSVSVDRLYDLRHIRRAVGRDELTGEPLHVAKPDIARSHRTMGRAIRRRVASALSSVRARGGQPS